MGNHMQSQHWLLLVSLCFLGNPSGQVYRELGGGVIWRGCFFLPNPPDPAPQNDRILLRWANTKQLLVVSVYVGVIWLSLNWAFPELKDFIKHVGLSTIDLQPQIWNESPHSRKPVSMDTFGREYCLVAQQPEGRRQSTLLSDTFWD